MLSSRKIKAIFATIRAELNDEETAKALVKVVFNTRRAWDAEKKIYKKEVFKRV